MINPSEGAWERVCVGSESAGGALDRDLLVAHSTRVVSEEAGEEGEGEGGVGRREREGRESAGGALNRDLLVAHSTVTSWLVFSAICLCIC